MDAATYVCPETTPWKRGLKSQDNLIYIMASRSGAVITLWSTVLSLLAKCYFFLYKMMSMCDCLFMTCTASCFVLAASCAALCFPCFMSVHVTSCW